PAPLEPPRHVRARRRNRHADADRDRRDRSRAARLRDLAGRALPGRRRSGVAPALVLSHRGCDRRARAGDRSARRRQSELGRDRRAAGLSAAAIAVAGLIALAVAMGIGRFAFTPILPMMLHDKVVDLHTASWLASANYIGYLTGALLCTFVPPLWSRRAPARAIDGPALVRLGLVATTLLTL